MIDINDRTEGNICGAGEWEVVQREVVQRLLRIIRLFLLGSECIAVSFLCVQLMWLQLIIESADFHPDTHTRATQRAHTYTHRVSALLLFLPVKTELNLNAGTYDSTRIDFLALWLHSGLCGSSEFSVRPWSHIPGREQRLAVGYNAELLTLGGNERQSVARTRSLIGRAGAQVPRVRPSDWLEGGTSNL